jgi:hypothetical protein
MLVVTGHEDHERQGRRTAHRAQHFESIETRHLNVEEHEPGPLALDRLGAAVVDVGTA